MVERDPITFPDASPADTGLAVQAAAELRETLQTVAREIDTLDPLRRTLLAGVIRQQSGMGVEDWLKAAESLEILMDAIGRPGRIGDPERRSHIMSLLEEWKEKLERLASCFRMASQLAGSYVKDPAALAGSLQVLAYRQQVVCRMIAEIERIERS